MSGWKETRRNDMELRRILARVLRRWRTKRLLLGAMLVVLSGIASFAVAALLMPSLGDGWAATAARAAALAVPLLAAARWLVRPAFSRIPDERVALYIEEHEPSLGSAVLGALAGDSGSRALAERAARTALARLHEVEDGARIDRAELRRFAALMGLLAATGLVTMAFRPAFLDVGATRFLGRGGPAGGDGVAPTLAVEPGDATVPTHGDVSVRARVLGLEPLRVELLVFAPGDSIPERRPMARAEDGSYGALVFGLTGDADYLVEADGFRSERYRLTVADLPYAGRVDVELRFPAYTGLAPRVLRDVRDIAAPRGTRARFVVQPTASTPGGSVLLDDGRRLALAPRAPESGNGAGSGAAGEGTPGNGARVLEGDVPLDRDGFYRIELVGPGGDAVRASPEYAIDVLEDGAPTVRVEEPGRDSDATSIDEVFLEVAAEDDYGVGTLELILSVNGQREDTLRLHGGGRAPSEVSAGHTLFLEEFGLQPGDVIAYHARALDTDRVTGPKAAVSDLYFLRIRPFERNFRQADGAGAGGGEAGSQLSSTQRQIIAATYNLLRDSARYAPAELAENLATIALSQERLREQVQRLVDQLRTRGVPGDTSLARVAEILPAAGEAMEEALAELRADRARPALPPEQRALVELQRAEAVFRDVQVAQGQGGGGQGGEAEDLADLFELELDKMQNQYETVRRAQQEESARELDETLERLRELARRQQREAERARRAAQAGADARGGGGGEQRDIAREAEEEARRLERLARERSQPELERRARELREAAEQMRRAAAGSDPAAAGRALERLRAAESALQGDRADALRRGIRGVRDRASELARAQEDLGREAGDATGAPAGPQAERAAERVRERKELQAEELRALQDDIDRLSRAAAGEQPDAARALRDAEVAIRERRVEDKIDYSRELVRPGGPLDLSRRIEAMIQEDLRDVERRLEGAARALTEESGDTDTETLGRARDLARALDSMEERLRQQRGEQRARRAGERPGEGAEGEGDAEGGEGQGDPGGERGRAGEGAGQGEGAGRAGGEPGAPPTGEGGRPATGSDRPGAAGAGGPGAVSPGLARQFQREAAERLREAEALRRRLIQEGRDEEARTLAEVMEGLRSLADGAPFLDVDHAARLQEEIAAGARRLELALRKQILGDEAARSVIAGSGEVPEEYRELVEEYYRALAGERQR